MASFHLKIIASDKVFFDGEAESVTVPGQDGGYTFMARHEELVLAVQPGLLRYKMADGTEKYAVVGSGFAQTANNRAAVLVDTAERPEDIDEVRAKEALEHAKEELRQKQSVQEYHISQASLARAISRLKGRKWEQDVKQ